MDILLWRHADAEDIAGNGTDLDRSLTSKGHRQATAIARWLKQNGPREPHLLVSPARRTQQTAQALSPIFETSPDLAPDATVQQLIKASGWHTNRQTPRAVILVGHQPTLGQLAAQLVSGQQADWAIKKGALWWLQTRAIGGDKETVIKLVLPPDFA